MKTFWIVAYTIVVLANLGMGMVVWGRRPGSSMNRWYAITTLFSALYTLPYLFLVIYPTTIFYARVAWIGLFIIPSYIMFLLYFLNAPAVFIRRLKLLLLAVTSLLFVIAITTDLLIKEIICWYPDRNGVYGSLNPVARLYILLAVSYAIYILCRGYINLSPINRQKTKYFLLAMAIYGVSGLFFVGINPLLGGKRFDDIPTFFSLIWAGTTVYAILKYRFMGIELVLSKMLAVILVVCLLFGLHIIFVGYIKDWWGYPFASISSFGILMVVLFGTPLRSKIQNGMNKLIVGGKYDYQDILKESIKAVVSYINFESLLDYLLKTIRKSFGNRKIAFIFMDEQSKYKIMLAHGMGSDVVGQQIANELVKWLKEKKKIYIKGEWIERLPKEEFPQFYQGLERLELEVCLPLVSKGELLGILAMDNKANGEIYTTGDIQLLEALGDQATIALENARLYKEAITDGLTQLYHHRYFELQLKEKLDESKGKGEPLGLLMVDIDHFKPINDKYGHPFGDRILRDIARILKENIRAIDLACRYGGEEFTVILMRAESLYPGRSFEDMVKQIAERISKKVEDTEWRYNEHIIKITISIGIAIYDGSGVDINSEQFIEVADKALYSAKNRGRNRIETGSIAMH